MPAIGRSPDCCGSLLCLLATHVRLSFRLAAVIVVAGDVDFTFEEKLPVCAGDWHQVARVECDDRRLAAYWDYQTSKVYARAGSASGTVLIP